MRRHDTTSANQTRVKFSDYLVQAPWLVPLAWSLSVVTLVLDVLQVDEPIEWGHISLWFAISALSASCYSMVRHIIARLTEIIALWQDDVHIQKAVPGAQRLRDLENVIPMKENVVPILRTLVTHRTGTEDWGQN